MRAVTTIEEVMVPNPVTLEPDRTTSDAGKIMKDRNIGDVVVCDNKRVFGIVTDRDIVVRAVAEGKDPRTVKLKEICSQDVVALSRRDSIDAAVQLMRKHAVRRLPVIENGRPVGIVTLGDLAVERDPDSALADVSAAPPNH
jgi:CBS domain-containing protein